MRLRRLGLAAITIVLGLGTRPLKRHYETVGSALGDALWALMVFLLLGALFPKLPLKWLALSALMVAFLVETSQLWHTPWLDSLRHTTLGALAIAGSFSVEDLLCYTVGVVFGLLLEKRYHGGAPTN